MKTIIKFGVGDRVIYNGAEDESRGKHGKIIAISIEGVSAMFDDGTYSPHVPKSQFLPEVPDSVLDLIDEANRRIRQSVHEGVIRE